MKIIAYIPKRFATRTAEPDPQTTPRSKDSPVQSQSQEGTHLQGSTNQGTRLIHTCGALLLSLGILYICLAPSTETAISGTLGGVKAAPVSDSSSNEALSDAATAAVSDAVIVPTATALLPAGSPDTSTIADPSPTPTREEFVAAMFTPLSGIVTSDVGLRDDPFGSGTTEYHRGVDIMPNDDLAVRAADDGIVSSVDCNDSYGNYLIIDHLNGFSTLYAHCEYIYLEPNAPVSRGMLIAKAGSTGRATGTHLHFEILEDSRED